MAGDQFCAFFADRDLEYVDDVRHPGDAGVAVDRESYSPLPAGGEKREEERDEQREEERDEERDEKRDQKRDEERDKKTNEKR